MQWYYGVGNEVSGPVENEALVRLVASGEVRAETPVWASYLGNWTAAGKIDGLFVAAGVPLTPSVAPVASGQAAAEVYQEVAVGAATLANPAGAAGGIPAASVAVMEAPVQPVQPVQPDGQPLQPGLGGEPQSPEARQSGPVPGSPDVAPVPRIETGKLGLTAAPPRQAVVQNPAGIPLNPTLPAPGESEREKEGGNPAAEVSSPEVTPPPSGAVLNPNGIPVPGTEAPNPNGIPVPGAEAPNPNGIPVPGAEAPNPNGIPVPGAEALNPNGIPVPGAEAPNPNGIPVPGTEALNPETSKMGNGTFAEGGKPEPVDDGFSVLNPAGGADRPSTSEFAPARQSISSAGHGWKKWLLPGVVALVLLAGGAALADKFVLGGKLFGLGARPDGPYRYFPESPRFAFNIEVRGMLLNPVVAGKIEAGGGMNMVDQMMHSAVGLRPYDIEDVKVVGTDLSMTTPRFVCIITTTKKIPEELLVEKLFGEGKPEKVGGLPVYELPMMGGGDVVACIADETTFLLGGRDEIESVLTRTEDPVFEAGELEMVNVAADSKAIFSMSFDFEMLKKIADLSANLPGSPGAVQSEFLQKEAMRMATAVSMEVGITEEFDIDYRVDFDSEESAEAAFKELEREFEEMDGTDFAAQIAASGGGGAGAIDPAMIRKMMEAVEFSRDGVSVRMHMGLPIDFFEKLVGQNLNQVGSF